MFSLKTSVAAGIASLTLLGATGIPVALAAPAAKTVQAPASNTQVVRRGDSLWRIARQSHTTVAKLVELNAGRYQSLRKNARLIHKGWTLRVG